MSYDISRDRNRRAGKEFARTSPQSATKKLTCPHCGVRYKTVDHFEESRDVPTKDYCDICRHASKIANTSIDEARNSIRLCSNVDVLYMAAKMERARTNPRSSFIPMLKARLNKLIGMKDCPI